MSNNIEGENPAGQIPQAGQEWDTSGTDTPAAAMSQGGTRRGALAKLGGLLPLVRTESGVEEGQSITRRSRSSLGVYVARTWFESFDWVSLPPAQRERREEVSKVQPQRHEEVASLTIGDPARRAFASIHRIRVTEVTFADPSCRLVREHPMQCVHDSRVFQTTEFGIAIGGKEAKFKISSRAERMDVRYFHPLKGHVEAQNASGQSYPPEGTEGDGNQAPSIE